MKVLAISTKGISNVFASPTQSKSGNEYYCLSHGESGRGRWEVRIPLAAREFPTPEEHGGRLELAGDYKLVDLRKQDPRGNGLYLLALGEDDGKQLVFLSLSPGYRGGATYEITGKAWLIAEGEEAQGAAGRMGGASCPVILADGPCTISWHRSGRLYGGDADWVANFDGAKWIVAPVAECALEDAAMNY